MLPSFFGDDGIEAAHFAILGVEDWRELVGAGGEFGGEGDLGCAFVHALAFDFLSVDAEGGFGGGDLDPVRGAECLAGTRDVFSRRESGGDWLVRFFRPSEN